MERWNTQVREEDEALQAQVGALEAALKIDVNPNDRKVALRWIARTLGSALTLHLKKEEEVLFPALQRLLGEDVGAVTYLQEQHRELRGAFLAVAKLLAHPGEPDWGRWQKIQSANQAFVDLLEDHEKQENRLLIDVLEFSVKPKELKELAQTFREATRKAVKDPESCEGSLVHPQQKVNSMTQVIGKVEPHKYAWSES